ncbi:MAG: hypothetical protein AAB417_02110 [Patescibacteria group bacterium]
MVKRRDYVLEGNQEMTTLMVFLDAYNKSIPTGFPKVTLENLKDFQKLHPMLFKDKNEWSIEKHRKRLMDWLPSHRD